MANIPGITQTPWPLARTVHVDGARADSYTETGTLANPFKTVQAAVDHAEANLTPSQFSPVVIHIFPNGGPCYQEDVVIKKTGIDLKGGGSQGADTVSGSPYIRTLIVTNATAASVATFIANGGIADPVTNYGDLVADSYAPEVNNFNDISFGDPTSAGSDNTRMALGVGSACPLASVGLTFWRCTEWGPGYFRNAGYINFQDCTFSSPNTTFNVTQVLPNGGWCSYSADYDSGQDQPVDTSNNGLTGAVGTVFFGPIVLDGEARLGYGSVQFAPAMLQVDLDLNGTSQALVYGGVIRGNVTVEGDAVLDLRGTHVQGDLTLDNTGGAVSCTMQGGHLTGTLTDAGGRLLSSDGVEAEDTSYAVTAADRGKTFTNEGAGAIVPFTLPTGDDEGPFTFAVLDADGIRVTAPASHTIRLSTLVTITAGKIESTEIGASVTLRKVSAAEYVALYGIGTWSVETS